MKNNFEDAYKTFLSHWGYDAQSLMVIEEMSELTKALCKYKRFGKENSSQEIKDNILEEIADVLNTVEQLELYFGKEEIEEIRKQKIEKTLNKIEKEKR